MDHPEVTTTQGDALTTQKRRQHIRVPVLPEEKGQIEANARRLGISTAAYLRTLGMGYEPKGVVDGDKIDELMRINGDLGRLGGLLKLWLTNDERTARFGDATIRALLSKIEDTQGAMKEAIRSVVLPRSTL